MRVSHRIECNEGVWGVDGRGSTKGLRSLSCLTPSCYHFQVDAEANKPPPTRGDSSSIAKKKAGTTHNRSGSMTLAIRLKNKRQSGHIEPTPDGFLADHNEKAVKHATAQVSS